MHLKRASPELSQSPNSKVSKLFNMKNVDSHNPFISCRNKSNRPTQDFNTDIQLRDAGNRKNKSSDATSAARFKQSATYALRRQHVRKPSHGGFGIQLLRITPDAPEQQQFTSDRLAESPENFVKRLMNRVKDDKVLGSERLAHSMAANLGEQEEELRRFEEEEERLRQEELEEARLAEEERLRREEQERLQREEEER